METPEPRSWKWIQVAVVMAALIIGLVLAVWVENRPISPINVQAVPLPPTEARRMNLPNIIPSIAPDKPAPSTTQVVGDQLYGSQIDGATSTAPESNDAYKPADAGTPSADALASPNYGGASAAVSGQSSSGLPSQSGPSAYTPAPESASSTTGQPSSVPVDAIPGVQSGTSMPGSQSPAPDGSAGVPAAYSPAGTPITGSSTSGSSSTTGGF